jgi:uroporphyrinogen decarboxylase
VIEDLIGLGAAGVSCGADDSLAELKQRCRGRTAVVGALNGLLLRRWSPVEAAQAVRDTLDAVGRGGGFLLSDQHGEIPFQVSDEVLAAVAEAVRAHGGGTPSVGREAAP